MKVILMETIESLGIIGSEVDVQNGYARNYLFPQGKAVPATEANRKKLAMEKKKIDLQMAKERKIAEEMAARLEGVSCRIPARVADENRLYGSINVKDIEKELANQGIDINKKMILLSEPIKTLGTFSVPIRIYKDIEPEITVEVVPE